MDPTVKWIMGIVGTVIAATVGTFFYSTSTTLSKLVTNVAVIKSKVEDAAEAAKTANLPPRLTATETQLSRVQARLDRIEADRWTRNDQHQFQLNLDMRFTRNEENIANLVRLQREILEDQRKERKKDE